MSLPIFPELPGLGWSVIKRPQWSTIVQKSVSGKEVRAALYSYPTWQFTLSYEVLRADALAELQTLVGFFNAQQGSYAPFLFNDATDNAVTDQVFGYGDGVQTKFQLARQIAGLENIEPIFATNGVPTIKLNGTLAGGWTATDGLITFASPPAAGSTLTWTGGFYYRVRFKEDAADFENFMYRLWKLSRLELVSVK